MEGGKVRIRREVAFDGGETWGVNHFDVTVVADLAATPPFTSFRFENPLLGYLSEGEVVAREDGTKVLHRRWKEGDAALREADVTLPVDLPVVPSYLVEVLASLLPREAGTCYRYRLLEEGTGGVGLPSALVVVGPEEIEVDGAKVPATRVEQRSLGGAMPLVYWVGPAGRVLRADYGAPTATLSTKEKALEGLHPEIRPRSAGN